MPTLEQINRGANYYAREAEKAQDQAAHHKRIGSPHAGAWAQKAVGYGIVAHQLRALADDAVPSGAA